jgi:hypothetical protein
MGNDKDPTTSVANGGEPSTLVFDVNETLIDFESIAPFLRGSFMISGCCGSGWDI